MLHIGDVKLPRALVKHADLVLMARRGGNHADDLAVARKRTIVDRPVTIDEVVERSDDAGLAFRAVMDVGALRIRGGCSMDFGETGEPVLDGGEAKR